MRRILSIAMGSLVASALVLAASPAASAGDSAAQEYRGAMIRQSVEEMPDPDRCGPSGIVNSATFLGRDTLGGAFEMSVSVCFVTTDQFETLRIFDLQGTGKYILPPEEGEEWTFRAEEYVLIGSPFPTCIQVPEKPVKFTFSDFTGENAGEQVVGHAFTFESTFLCGGIPPEPNPLVSFEGDVVDDAGDDDDDDDDGDDDDNDDK